MYSVVSGDTFELISRKVYGVETEANLIRSANPGVFEPLSPGTNLVTPPSANSLLDKAGFEDVGGPDETALLIDGNRYRYWESINFSRAIDSFDSVSFMSPFDPDVDLFRDTFKPFSFSDIDLSIGGEKQFRGTLISVTPKLSVSKNTVDVSCYSLPGVLNDCTPPASSFPLEFIEQDLKAIAETLIKPFGITAKFEAEQGPKFDLVDMKPGQTVYAFLTKLAKQRNLIISNTAVGELLFRQSPTTSSQATSKLDTAASLLTSSVPFLNAGNAGSPVAVLTGGLSPLISITPNFEAQRYYSSITGLEPALVGIPGAKYTARNTFAPGIIRPHTFEVDESSQGDVKSATESKLGRMFGSVVSYTLVVDTWRDSSGALWAPGSPIKVIAPRVMIYSEYEFLISRVGFTRSSEGTTATLTLVLPGAYSGELPGSLPWD